MLNAQKKLHGSTYNSSRVRGNHICESLANAGEISNSKSWFRFFRRKIPVQATYFGIYTYKIDSESLERIKIAMERTNNTQASQQHARTNQTTLHKQNTCKHNSSTADIASADVSASASTNLRARKRGKRAGLGGTSDTTSATLTRLFALTLLNSQNQSHRINQTKRRQER